ncbi:hypothetical protein BABINDRAFT_161758 [Babjeviella inositovora NRRL Y-12698]|uniref:Uncharacterized protein n=1 Tax=Babjeviella inositovora NRRL Y-12698 TaxID=984486 RepID=A0A1E3QNR3_9ASCO|nr:uncharacterized protein BABINDRAFT_161758 [Babjeviella inositovora NRRL Y-12698]ODQ79349.1 hypothetical protein BABINDRAFT_161758 [Babjeviella inositovora NRRL Y-12698]
MNSGFVLLLSTSMQLPIVEIDDYNPIFGILALLFGVLAMSDLVPLFEANTMYFESITPSRLVVFFSLAAYSYLGDSLYFCNNIVFIYCFMEVWFNMLLFSSLKDEKYTRIKAEIERLQSEEFDDETNSAQRFEEIMEDIKDQAAQ